MEEHSLLKGDIKKTFFTYLLPAIGGMLGTAAYVIGDTIIIGRALGSQGLAALNMVLPIFRLVNAIALMLGIGGATLMSIYKGKGQEDRAQEVFNTSILVSTFIGLLLILVRIFFLDKLVLFLGSTDYTFDMVKSYLGIYLYFNIFTTLNVALGIFIRNDGSPRLVMISTLISSIFNLVVDYILVFIFKLGIWGASFATAISPIVSLLVLSIHFVKGRNSIDFNVSYLNFSHMGRILRNGFPSFIIEFSIGIVIYIFNMVLIKIGGDLAVSVYGIIINSSLFVSAIFNGVAQAIQPIVSINYGAGKEDRILEAGRLGIISAFILGIFFSVIGLLFPTWLSKLFTSETGEIINLATTAIRLYFISFIFMGVNISVISYIQSKEYIKPSIIISLLRGSVYVIAFLIPLSKILGLNGVWLSVPLAELATFITYMTLNKEVKELVIYTIGK